MSRRSLSQLSRATSMASSTRSLGDGEEGDESTHQVEETREQRKQRFELQMAAILRQKTVRMELQNELHKWKKAQTLLQDENESTDTYQITEVDKSTYRSPLHAFVSYIADSDYFDKCIMLTIFVNAVFLAVESSVNQEKHGPVFEIADLIFVTIYTVEFVIKFYAEPIGYWKSNYNRFDFAILIISYIALVELEGVDFTFIRVLRAMRGLRALRSVSFIRALRVLVNALVKTMASVANLLILLLLIMYIFAIVGFYFFGPGADGNTSTSSLTEGEQEWATLENALLSLWVYVTADGWVAIQSNLDDRGYNEARIYTVLFIFVGHFIFTNLFIGVIIENLNQAQVEEKLYQRAKRGAMAKAKKHYLTIIQAREFARLNKFDPESSGTITLRDAVKHLDGKLRHDDMVPMTSLMCNGLWLDTYLTTLDLQENMQHRVQQLHFELAHVLAEMTQAQYEEEQF